MEEPLTPAQLDQIRQIVREELAAIAPGATAQAVRAELIRLQRRQAEQKATYPEKISSDG